MRVVSLGASEPLPEVVAWWPVDGAGVTELAWVDHDRTGQCMTYRLHVGSPGGRGLDRVCPEGLGCATAGRGPLSIGGLAMLLAVFRRRRTASTPS